MAARPLRMAKTHRDWLTESGVREKEGELPVDIDQSVLRRLSHTDRLAQIGILAASVAHEINNPAAFILANLTVMGDSIDAMSSVVSLLERVLRELPLERAHQVRNELRALDAHAHIEELSEMVDDNLSGIRHIAQIVTSLRSFARNDHDVASVDIHKVVDAALHMMAKKMRDCAKVELDLKPVPAFSGEPTRLAQVIMNLLVNAVHAIGGGDPEENKITVSTRAKNGHCFVVVEDTGCGMTPEIQRRIFEPFFTTKADGEGTGLGLPLCRDIARQHGGKLHCRSAPGKGTRFELVIPLGANAQAQG